MNLADAIVQSECMPLMLGAEKFRRLTNKISDAQKFVFDQAASQASTDLSFGRAQSLVDAIDFARCPFQNTWIELDVRHLPAAEPGLDEGPIYGVVGGSTIPVDRHGYLFQSNPAGTMGRVSMFWEHTKAYQRQTETFQATGLMVGPQSAIFEIGFHFSEADEDEELEERIFRKAIKEGSKHIGLLIPKMKDAIWTEKDRPALQAIQDRFAISAKNQFIEGSPYQDELKRKRTPQQIMDTISRDCKNEFSFIISMLTLLNCRSSVVFSDRNPKKVNAARLRRKQIPYFAHQVVELKLSGDERRLLKQAGEKDSPRAHLVRGHFKVRKAGVYWWSAHVRGDASKGWVNKDYEVVA